MGRETALTGEFGENSEHSAPQAKRGPIFERLPKGVSGLAPLHPFGLVVTAVAGSTFWDLHANLEAWVREHRVVVLATPLEAGGRRTRGRAGPFGPGHW